MKRFGEKATREALANGARIRNNDWYCANAGYRVRIGGEDVGYIVGDLFSKLLRDGTIEKTGYGYSWSEYAAPEQEQEQEQENEGGAFGLAACIESVEFYRDTLHMDDAAIMVELLHSQEINGVFFNRTMWDAFDAVCPDFPVSLEVCREIYNNTLADDGETTDRARAARNIREYAETIRAEQQPENIDPAPEQEPEQEPEPIYIDESAPESNSIPNVYYLLTIESKTSNYTRHLYTVDELHSFVYSIRHTGETIKSAYRVNTATGEKIPFIPETRQERTDRENRAHCRRIAETLEAYAKGTMYRCPECGEEIELDDLDDLTTETDDGETLYRLPCGCTVDEEPEQLGLYDYFDDVLDIEYRIESDRKTLRSVSLMVAFGGPTIYIDTAENAVLLYWWTDRARYSFDSWIGDEINDWAEELWNC